MYKREIRKYQIFSIDILSFFIAVIIGEYTSYKLMIEKFKCSKIQSFIFLLILLVCFIVFTFFTPILGIFKDPLTAQYGIL